MKIIYGIVSLFFRCMFKVRVIGKEHIPIEGAYILCPNHHSNLDPPLMALVFKKKTYFMAKKELFKKRWIAFFLTQFGAFPVKRGESDKEAIVTTLKLLKSNQSICIFPEGQRTEIGQEGEIKTGALRIAQKVQCPIIPIHIDSSYKWFAPMIITIHPPLLISKEADLEQQANLLKDTIHGKR